LTGRYNSTNMGILRLPIISSPTPNVCLAVRVSVSATNEIGTNFHNATLPSSLGTIIIWVTLLWLLIPCIVIESKAGCPCYLERGMLKNLPVESHLLWLCRDQTAPITGRVSTIIN
jgi:hypothetical protein